jgi:hypothetical protein
MDKLHGVTNQMTTILIFTAVKTSKLTSTVPTNEQHDDIFGCGDFNASILSQFSWYIACTGLSDKITQDVRWYCSFVI